MSGVVQYCVTKGKKMLKHGPCTFSGYLFSLLLNFAQLVGCSWLMGNVVKMLDGSRISKWWFCWPQRAPTVFASLGCCRLLSADSLYVWAALKFRSHGVPCQVVYLFPPPRQCTTPFSLGLITERQPCFTARAFCKVSSQRSCMNLITTIGWLARLEPFLLGEVDVLHPLTSMLAHWQGTRH